MKSKAQINGHPLHPMLVAFPIAFLTGTLIFDIIYSLMNEPPLRSAAYYMELAGIIGGLAAAGPGMVDLFGVVPPKSSARVRGIRHMLSNVTAIALFLVAWLLRRQETTAFHWVLLLEAAGFILMLIGGILGSTLIYRNQIAVDHRYAFAGKWKEVWLKGDGGKHAVAEGDTLKRDQLLLIHAGERRIVLGRTEEGYVAFDDYCTHRGGSLAGGMMICGTVQCPWHGSQFDVKTGAVKAGPAKDPIRTYEVREEGGKVYVVI